MSRRAIRLLPGALMLLWAPLGAGERAFLGPEPILLEAPATSFLAGDWNGDGSLDFVATHRSRSVVSVLLRAASDGFAPAKTYPAGLGPAAAAAGDLNGDGHADLLVLESVGGTATVLPGAGDGTFAAGCEAEAGPSPALAALGDLDGDGDLDLAVASQRAGEAVRVLTGDGRCGLAAPQLIAAPGFVLDLGAADLDGDGSLDLELVQAGAGASISLRKFRGPSFDAAAGAEAVLPSPARAARRLDLGRDGRVDLVALTVDEQLMTVRAAVDGTLTAVALGAPEPGESLPGFLDIVDADGDAIADAVAIVERPEESRLRLHAGRSDGGLAPARDLSLGTSDIATAVFVRGLREAPDLVAARDVARGAHFFRVLPDGGLAAGALMPLGAAPELLRAIDLGADGTLDVVARAGRSVTILGAAAPGGLEVLAALELPLIPALFPGESLLYRDLEVLDHDGDGRIDLGLSAASGGAIELGDPGRAVIAYLDATGTLAESGDFIVNSKSGDVAAGDFNGDGLGDLVVTDTRTEELVILEGAASRFGRVSGVGGIALPQTAVAAADWDGDGRHDIAVATALGITLLLGAGDGTFSRQLEVSDAEAARWVAAADEDGDGELELIAWQPRGLWLTRGIASGAPATELVEVGLLTEEALVGDVDADGSLDLVTVEGTPRHVALRRPLAGAAGAVPELYAVGSEPRALALFDATGDGRADLLASDGSRRRLVVLAAAGAAPGPRFRRGDADGDGAVALTDAVRILGRLFRGGAPLTCEDAADADDDGAIDLTDALAILLHLFRGGPPPPAPGPESCGGDGTADALLVCEDACG